VTGPVERRLPLRLSSDELELQQVLRGFLSSVVPPPTPEAASWATLDPEGKVWQRMADELGLQSLAVPEDLEGQGFGMTELATVFLELGRVTCAAPLFGSVALAGRLLTHLPAGDDRDRVLSGIADGSLKATVALEGDFTADASTVNGRASAVVDAPYADVVLVPVGADVLYVEVGADGVEIHAQDGLDLARALGVVTLENAAATVLARNCADAVARSTAEATLLLAAELTGVAQAALHEAVAYSKIRSQFDRPIGSFQSLKHRMADMLVATEGAWSTSRHAALLCDAEDPAPSLEEVERAAGIAKAAASTAATFVTGENIQIHGGMGFTWEHPAHLRFRRARSAAVLLGSPSQHRARVAAALTSGDTHGRA